MINLSKNLHENDVFLHHSNIVSKSTLAYIYIWQVIKISFNNDNEKKNLKLLSNLLFLSAELAEIKKTTYSKMLCSVMNNIGVFHSFQPRLMLRSNIRG